MLLSYSFDCKSELPEDEYMSFQRQKSRFETDGVSTKVLYKKFTLSYAF